MTRPPDSLPYPIIISFGPGGAKFVRRCTWKEYHRMNPVVTYEMRDGKVVVKTTNC